MALHACQDCGMLHDSAAEPAESEAIILARIARDQAVEIARIEAGARRREAEAMVDAAHEEARGEVGAAEAQAELIGDAIEASTADDDEAPEPLEIIAPVTDVDITEEEDDAPPPAEGSPVPEPEKKTRGLGMWLQAGGS